MKSVAYLLDSFPRLSETFIINEILEVKQIGVDVKIFARKKMDDGMGHIGGQILSKETYYLPSLESVSRIRLYLYHLYFLLRSPLTYMSTFFFALKRRSKGTLWFLKMSVIYALPIRKQKVHHIHSHFAGVASEYAMLISMLLNIPYSFTAHGYSHIYKNPPKDFDDRGRIAKRVITISDYNKSYLHETFGIPLEKIEVIHCGVKPDFLIPHVENMDKDNIILSVGRLVPIKGHEYLIKACRILKGRGYSFRCLIVGEGEEKNKIKKFIKDLQLENYVSLEGAKSHEEVKNYYKLAKVFVQPSLQETMGVAAMEALAHGVPVIATNVYGVPELVKHGENGFLVNPKDFEGIAHHIETLLKDSELCQKLGENGLKKVKKDFNLQKQGAKLIKVWFENDE